jgi:pimeloyl-ACP methyl ester carboxylesterase
MRAHHPAARGEHSDPRTEGLICGRRVNPARYFMRKAPISQEAVTTTVPHALLLSSYVPDVTDRSERGPVSRRARSCSQWLALVALLAAGCGTGSTVPATERLQPCRAEQGPTDAYCGTLTVFEDREAGTGRSISLHIVVLPALTDETRADPLFFLAGGPGQGAALMAVSVQAAFARVQRHRDIVLVDQRGTGRSNPLNCPVETNSLAAAFGSDEDALSKLHACLERLDADVRQYTTPVAMDDLDEVRRHLGYDRINLYGGSYGTRAALVYLRQHGNHVRSIVLDGAAPTDMRLPLFTARDAGRSLQALTEACTAEDGCRAAYPNLPARLRALLARLEASPDRVRLTHPRTGVPETVEISARSLASIVFGALYSPATAALLPILIERAETGDYQGLVALAFAGDQSENMSVGMQLSVICSEDAPLISSADVTRETAGSIFGVHLVSGQRRACEMWPRASLPPDYHAPIRSEVPALVLSGAVDPVTPPAWGERVVAHLPKGRHLVAAATGHGVIGTPCGARLIADFLEGGDAAALDAGCLEQPRHPPFFLTPSGPDPGRHRSSPAR